MAIPTIASVNPSSGTTVGGNSVIIKGTLGSYTYATGISVSPNSGTAAGGNTVTIIGTNLLNASKVRFGLRTGAIQGTPTSTSVSVKAPAGDRDRHLCQRVTPQAGRSPSPTRRRATSWGGQPAAPR
ncbi:IPT/TIG domain-containing protein [Amycolatopsis pigmentata]|uniref:IPT/TIG domain-containing protein n=1 Tax=Amycolatopsis pigmentata TaxID=450801 RepID=A0ABW5G1A0_9PSEU